MLKFLLPLSCTEFTGNVTLLTFTSHDIFVGYKPFEAYWPSCMYAAGTDADLCPKTIAESISEARAGVDERARGVDAPAKLRCVLFGFGDNHVGVVRGVRVDVRYRGRERGDGEDGEGEGKMFGLVIFAF